MATKFQPTSNRGRKEIEINWIVVCGHLMAHCSGVKIASTLGISYATLARRCEEEHGVNFAEYSRLKRSEGVDMLKAKMFDLALKGDKSMLIWLSKQYCGFSDSGVGPSYDEIETEYDVRSRLYDVEDGSDG